MLKTEGIVLREMKYRDTSKILTIFTKDYGKLSVMARGALKPKSQLIANTQVFSYNEYQLYSGRNFYYLNQAYILDSFYSIRDRIERVVYGQYILELLDKSMESEQVNERAFMLVLKTLQILSGLDSDFLKLITAFELKYISFLGYRPSLNKCVHCNCTDKLIYFSIHEGGLVCSSCIYESSYIKVNQEMQEFIKAILYTPLDRLDDIRVKNSTIKMSHDLIVKYILYNIDRKKFNSLNMVEALE